MDSFCFALLLSSLAGLCLGIEFTGAPGLWTRYARWDASTRSDLSFQFKTELSSALMLYFDDGGYCDFVQLMIVEGKIQLKLSIDCFETEINMDKLVNDDKWHFLMISRNDLRTVLVLDGETKSAEVKPQRQYMKIVSDLFIGGVPQDIRKSALTLNEVQSKPSFKGFIEDLKYGDSAPVLLGSQFVKLVKEGICTVSPCENGGICSLIEGEVACDCSTTGYMGRYCTEEVNRVPGFSHLMMGEQGRNKAREDNSATFRGSEYFCYDLSQNPIQSSSDEITLSFRTWQRNGLILHTGKSADYVNLALKDGAVSLVINLGSGAFEALVEPVNGKFNDNAWHDVKVTRNLRQVMVEPRVKLLNKQKHRQDGKR